MGVDNIPRVMIPGDPTNLPAHPLDKPKHHRIAATGDNGDKPVTHSWKCPRSWSTALRAQRSAVTALPPAPGVPTGHSRHTVAVTTPVGPTEASPQRGDRRQRRKAHPLPNQGHQRGESTPWPPQRDGPASSSGHSIGEPPTYGGGHGNRSPTRPWNPTNHTHGDTTSTNTGPSLQPKKTHHTGERPSRTTKHYPLTVQPHAAGGTIPQPPSDRPQQQTLGTNETAPRDKDKAEPPRADTKYHHTPDGPAKYPHSPRAHTLTTHILYPLTRHPQDKNEARIWQR